MNAGGKENLRIAVDLPWQAAAHMGTGAYSETMVRALAQAAPEACLFLIVPRDAPRGIDLPNVSYRELPDVWAPFDGSRQLALPSMLEELKAGVLFAPATLLPVIKVCPMVATVHDLAFLKRPEFYSPGLVAYLKRCFAPSMAAADRIVAISKETKNDLTDIAALSEERITVIVQPVRDAFHARLSDLEAQRHLDALGLNDPFFFHVSNLAPHKNAAFALDAFAGFLRAKPNAPHLFVVAGGGVAPNRPPDLAAHAERLGIAGRLRIVGRLDDEALKALYQCCEAFLFPSLFEGWGLPVAEARAMGARILAAPEVPAALSRERIELDPAIWADAMGADRKDQEAGEPVSATEAGKALYDLLRLAAAVPTGQPEASSSNRGVTTAVNLQGGAVDTARSRISGCTIVRNAVKLKYPLDESIASYAPICREIVISWDSTSEDETGHLLQSIAARFPQVRLVESTWNLNNRKEGSELARQTQLAFGECSSEWTLYIQADEALHEDAHALLLAKTGDEGMAGLAFQRRSFFKSLDQEIPEHYCPAMVRFFRTGHGRSVGDAMHVQIEGHPGRIEKSAATLFNYSRLGCDDDISVRSNNLNRFYHDDDHIASLDPDRNKRWETATFDGTHPAPIEARFRNKVSPAPAARAVTERPIHLVFTVDDIRPQSGFGLELDSGPVAMLRQLHEEFGCRFTLFMPTNFYARHDLRDHREWFERLLTLDCFEVACHGHHHWNLKQGLGDMEYHFESREEARWNLDRSLGVFRSLGYLPRGVKAPGWGHSPHAREAMGNCFAYQADHFLGGVWDISHGLPRLPYTRCIHESLDELAGHPGDALILHSHISPEGGRHDNGWEPGNFARVRAFLRRLVDRHGPRVRFLTAAESRAQARLWNLPPGTRKLFLDCGGHDGCSVRRFRDVMPRAEEYEIHSFEPNPEFRECYARLDVHFHEAAVWTHDGEMDFFLSRSHTKDGSSLTEPSYTTMRLPRNGVKYSVVLAVWSEVEIGTPDSKVRRPWHAIWKAASMSVQFWLTELPQSVDPTVGLLRAIIVLSEWFSLLHSKTKSDLGSLT